MGQLRGFLQANRSELVNFVQGNEHPINLENIYGRLVKELVTQFPMEKNGAKPVVDKAHIELAIALLESLWCGWLSQAKSNRKAYDPEWPSKFKEAIAVAFEVGQEYASVKP